MNCPLGDFNSLVCAQRGKRLPVLPTWEELQKLFTALSGRHRLFAELLYGTRDAPGDLKSRGRHCGTKPDLHARIMVACQILQVGPIQRVEPL